MPQMTFLPGYTSAAVGSEGFDEEADEIKRRRLLLNSILSQDQTKGMTGLAGGLGNFALGLARGVQGGQLDEQARDLSQRRADFARQAMEDVPQPTAAQPEVNPSAPPAALEQVGGGPPVPSTYEPPVEPTGGIVPQPMTYEHKDATPFLPTTPAQWAKYGAKYGSVSPFIAGIAATGFKEATELPAKQEAARLVAQEKREENLRRQEDRIADNKREERRLEETIRTNQTNEGIRAQAQASLEQSRAETHRLQAQANEDRVAARTEKKSDQEKQVVRQTERYAHQLNAEKIPELDLLLGNVETELKKYEDPKSPTGYKPIPGVGIVGYKKPEVMLDKDELAMRRAVEPLRHLITLSTAGLSQTQSEMQAVLTQDLGLGTGSSDESFIKAIPGLRARLEARKNAIGSGFDPEAVDTYHKRLKDKAPPPAATPPAAPVAPKAVGPQPGEVKSGYRFKGGNPALKENWEKV